MHVQRVLLPDVRRESWTVHGDDGPVEPIERYLAHLTGIERSPNMVKAYARDLKDWFVFLTGQGALHPAFHLLPPEFPPAAEPTVSVSGRKGVGLKRKGKVP